MEKECWHLGNKEFSCSKDAQKAAKQQNKKIKYHEVDYEIKEITGYDGVGRPKKGAETKIIGYRLSFNINKNAEKIKIAKAKKGRFILSTNQLSQKELPDSEVLKEYKLQSGTELGFKFIKDSSFHNSSFHSRMQHRCKRCLCSDQSAEG